MLPGELLTQAVQFPGPWSDSDTETGSEKRRRLQQAPLRVGPNHPSKVAATLVLIHTHHADFSFEI